MPIIRHPAPIPTCEPFFHPPSHALCTGHLPSPSMRLNVPAAICGREQTRDGNAVAPMSAQLHRCHVRALVAGAIYRGIATAQPVAVIVRNHCKEMVVVYAMQNTVSVTSFDIVHAVASRRGLLGKFNHINPLRMTTVAERKTMGAQRNNLADFWHHHDLRACRGAKY